MQRDVVELAQRFIEQDIGRELALADASESWLKRIILRLMGIQPGGGNFLGALGLLCYTEFAGRLKANDFSDDNSGACFNTFFDDLGPGYAALRQTCPVYKDLRCGLAHAYFVKRDCMIGIVGPTGAPGVAWDGRRYYIRLRNYFVDFSREFTKLVSGVP
jgi:hypothetical protein